MKNFGIILFLCFNYFSFSQSKTELYIEKFFYLAVQEMKEFKIPASITLSQGILESGNGESRLATEGKNHFGIKCHGWEGEEIYADDDELNECFRKYKKVEDSYRDHSLFLSKRGRYSFLFELDITDYKSWAKGLKKAGYATSPTYAEKLISLIERYNLQKFDVDINPIGDKQFFLSHNYGFPFFYGLGLTYIKEGKYLISTDVNSSFFFSSTSLAVGIHLWDNLYTKLSVNGIYHGFTEDNIYKFNYGVHPQLNYLLDTKNKKILINTGVIYSFEKIKDYSFIPSFSLTYLIN